MNVKFFMGSGHDGVFQVEGEVNTWIDKEKPNVVKVETNMCSMSDAGPNEMYQCALVSVWYVEKGEVYLGSA